MFKIQVVVEQWQRHTKEGEIPEKVITVRDIYINAEDVKAIEVLPDNKGYVIVMREKITHRGYEGNKIVYHSSYRTEELDNDARKQLGIPPLH